MGIRFRNILLAGVATLALTACGSDEPADNSDTGGNTPGEVPGVAPENVERVILVYAVNKSSLSYDFDDDAKEMLKALEKADLTKYRLLVYSTANDNECVLSEGVRDKDGTRFAQVKSYPRDVTSTHPDRIKEVISDALAYYPDASYDLFLWGHGMSWTYYNSTHTIKNAPIQRAYGGEYNSTTGYTTDWTNIDELAAAVPDKVFDTIWFDCCYMAGIEVAYQFRDKCSTMVAYPSEVWQYGLAYDQTLPYLMSETHDIIGSAKSFYNYYNATGQPVTVAVMDMSKIEDVARAAKNIYTAGDLRPETSSLVNYSRTASSPYYDFRQLVCESADMMGLLPQREAFEKAFDQFVVYSATSTKDFSLRPWDYENIHGVSTHLPTGSNTASERYYLTLDWAQRMGM